MYRLPERYLTLLNALAARPGEKRTWLGDVGIWRGPATSSDARLEVLTQRRWKGMHPDLVPFAEDGFGNLFCFVHRAAGSVPSHAIVYWMYETYRAVPIASSFDAFLRWMTLTAAVAARNNDPVIDHEHVQQELLPLLTSIGLDIDNNALETGNDTGQPAVHKAFLQLDPHSPGSLICDARRLLHESRNFEALEAAHLALRAFPGFTAAQTFEASVLAADNDPQAARALFKSLRMPMVYGGDLTMSFFGAVPRVDPAVITDALRTHPELDRIADDDPLWILATQDDPVNPSAWVQVALDYANAGELDDAVTMATNALWLSLGESIEPQIHGLLRELYEVLGHPWHAAAMARWEPNA